MAIGNTVFDTGSHQRQKPPRFPQSQHFNNSTTFHERNLLYSSGTIALIVHYTPLISNGCKSDRCLDLVKCFDQNKRDVGKYSFA
jgi:hypothetical protein